MRKPPNDNRSDPFDFELEKLWQAVSSISLDGFWIVDLHGRLRMVNDAYCAMSGYSREELLQMSVSDLDTCESPKDVTARIEKLLKHGDDRFEAQHHTRDGRIIDVEVSATFVAEHQICIGYLRDITAEKSAYRELQNALEFKRNLLDTANVLIIGLDSSGHVSFCNRFAATLTGYSTDELLGRNWFDLMVPRDRFPQVYEEFERLLQGGLPRVFENPILTRNGIEHHISWSNSEILDQGRVVGTLSFGIDITAERRAHEALTAAQQSYTEIVESAQDLIWACDLEGLLTYLNPASEEILGYRPDELIGLNFTDLTPEDRLDPDREVFAQFLSEGKELLNYETVRLAKNGKRVSMLINARAMHDGQGHLIGLQGTGKNITDRKEAEQKLRASEAYQRQILANAPFGVHLWRLDEEDILRFEGSNPAGDRILGIDHSRLSGKPILEAFPGLKGSPLPQRYAQLAREGGAFREDQFDYDAESIRGVFEVDAFQTAPGRLAIFFTDITERKQAEQELVRAREEAILANRAKDDFLGVISHELRTPLTPILGFTEMLSYKCTDHDHKEFLNHIHDAGERMLRLVEDILNFSRLNNKPLELHPSAFSPDSFFRRELEQAAPMANGNRLVLKQPDGTRFLPCPEGQAIVTDTQLLAQILDNLINNACKFTEQGRITLAYGVETLDTLHARLIFEVADTGVGIPPEQAARIWEPFAQVDSSSARTFQGVGLGLAICQRLTANLGGTIELESTPGEGSCFRVTIPVELQHPTAACEKKAPLPVTRLSDTPRILIIEDNDLNRHSLSTQVRVSKGEPVLACDGEEALELLDINGPGHFDAILLDLHLPGMSGFELFSALQRRFGRDALPPIIGVSADISERNRTACAEVGIQAFLEKPVRLDALRAVLAHWIRSPKN